MEIVEFERADNALSFRIPSSLHYVGQLIEIFETFQSEQGATDSGAGSVVLRELVVNAIQHGNKHRPESFVLVKVQHLEQGFTRIEVQDEGKGFMHGDIEKYMGQEDIREIKNRGYTLIRNLSKQILFNASGNKIIVDVARE